MSKLKRVYSFGKKSAEGRADMKNLLGGKGANLAEMCLLSLPVPAGFTITTEACVEYYENNHVLHPDLMPEVWAAMKKTEETMNMKYGDPENALLVSFRCPQVYAWNDGYCSEHRSLFSHYTRFS
jgi:pyruvate,orthophosphate dikinase